jgi:hypothetical protein
MAVMPFRPFQGLPRIDMWCVSGDTAPEILTGWVRMASFLKPTSRGKATALLDGVRERAAQYNDDPEKLYLITELRVFGSYITDAASLGDLDVAVAFTDRHPERDRAQAHRAYARASGRTFSSFINEMFWPTKELLQTLRKGSGYVNIHTEDISRFTSQWTVVLHPGPSACSVARAPRVARASDGHDPIASNCVRSPRRNCRHACGGAANLGTWIRRPPWKDPHA